jgi:hypothetical protein
MIMTAKPTLSTFTCRLLAEADFPAWDRFVERHPRASVYHLSLWRHILDTAFSKRWYLIAALQDGTIRAGLPLVHMQSRLFGNFLVSAYTKLILYFSPKFLMISSTYWTR